MAQRAEQKAMAKSGSVSMAGVSACGGQDFS